MTTVSRPICYGCAHFRATDLRCDAFPNGVPKRILLSEADHRRPFKGDHGIRFHPMKDADAVYADELFGKGET